MLNESSSPFILFENHENVLDFNLISFENFEEAEGEKFKVNY